jgi:four helix bundle protein
MGFQKFEDIIAWQKAHLLSNRVYEATRDTQFGRDYGLRDQIRRASVSVMANIAEGFGRRTNKDFANFLVMAHGSAAEVQSHLYVARDQNYITDTIFRELYELAAEVSRMTMSLCQHLRKTS